MKSCSLSLVLCLALMLGACARAAIVESDGGLPYQSDPDDVNAADGGLAVGMDARAPRDAASDPTRDGHVVDARVVDARPPDVPTDDASVRDASVRDASVVDAQSGDDAAVIPPTDAATDPGAASCDLKPCEGHCPLATPCCTLLNTCACATGLTGLCILPPIGLN